MECHDIKQAYPSLFMKMILQKLKLAFLICGHDGTGAVAPDLCAERAGSNFTAVVIDNGHKWQ